MKGGRKIDCLGTSELKEQHSGESSGFLWLPPMYPKESALGGFNPQLPTGAGAKKQTDTFKNILFPVPKDGNRVAFQQKVFFLL